MSKNGKEDEILAETEVGGEYVLPLGFATHDHEGTERKFFASKALVMTVCYAEGGHKSYAPFSDEEFKYETLVYLDGDTHRAPAFKAGARKKKSALAYHAEVVRDLKDGSLPLSFKVNYLSEVLQSALKNCRKG